MENMAEAQGLRGDQLRRQTNPDELRKQDAQAPPSEGRHLVGQSRAIEALNFGLDVRYKGYNIFVLGPPGTGKTSLTLQLIRERASAEKAPQDLCYLYHFKDPHRPLPIFLKRGMGKRLSHRIHKTIAGLARSMYQVLNDDHFQARASHVSSQSEEEEKRLFEQINEVAQKYDLRVEWDEGQFVVVPLKDGEPIDSELYDKLSEPEREKIQERAGLFQQESAPLINAQRAQEHQKQEALSKLEREAVSGLVEDTFAPLLSAFGKGKELRAYILGMKEHVLEHFRELIRVGLESADEGGGPSYKSPEDLPVPYQVNVMVHHSEESAPVVVEREPTLAHLFGYLEYKESDEGLTTDHTLLHPGALHRTNGGYLLLYASDLIRAPEVWALLKKATRDREIRFHDFSLDPDKPRIHGTMRPDATPMDVKLVLIGSAESYYRLMHEDEDFDRIFKIKAEFESWMPRSEENELELARFLKRIAEEESFLPPSYEALARMLDESAKDMESQDKLSTVIIGSIDLMCEADYWGRHHKREQIQLEDVEKALSFRDYRHNSIARSIIDSIDKGELLIDTNGWEIGQVNGLLVYLSQDYSFGVPTKITARTYVGDKGVINIDREADLSGAIHDKGSMILVGLMGGMYFQEHPLCFNASITFEQLYGDIEGDSASCAEFYALVSSLAQVPIDQGIAVTGSINQQGLLQPIGEVNAKIEGMFTICKMRGLTGRQGVIIPTQNASHLMLKDEVIEAVEAGKFHIWPIKHVHQGLSLLMDWSDQPVLSGVHVKPWSDDLTALPVGERIVERVRRRMRTYHAANNPKN